MALKLNLREAIRWPEKLARDVDVDGAFRVGAILAAMRVIAPSAKHEDGFSWHFSQTSYPPDFAAAYDTDVDAYRAMGALFIWDGGESTIQGDYVKPGDVFNLSPVKAGEMVFRDVWERGPADGSSSGYGIEKMAKRGEVHSCLASAYAYRYWWQAFNRAVYQLTESYPLLSRNITLEILNFNEYGSPFWTTIDTSYRALPFSFGMGPNGEAVMTPDDLCTGWMSAEAARDFVKVPKDKPWLVTAEDIDFSGVFAIGQDDDRRNELRNQWLALAGLAGFGSYVSEDSFVERLKFKDGLTNYWRGETEPKYGGGVLAQLSTDWRGRANSWRDEFPYHGFAAMLAYLEYFERRNVGYAITCELIDRINYVDHSVRNWHSEQSVVLEIPTNLYAKTEEPLAYKIKELPWSDVETTTRAETKQMHPEAEASVNYAGFTANGSLRGNLLDFYVTTLYKHNDKLEAVCDGDGNPFEQYLNDGAAAMEDELNRRANQAITDRAEEAEGILTVNVSSSGSSVLILPENTDVNNEKVYNKWEDYWRGNRYLFPFVPNAYNLEANRYFGLRTSCSSAVVKSGDFNILARLRSDVGVDSATSELLPVLPDPATDEGEVTVRLIRPEKMFYVQDNPNNPMMSFFIDLPGQPMERVQKPMPSIFIDNGSGLKQIFPPQPEEIGEYGIELHYLVPESRVEVAVESRRPEDETIPNYHNYSRLEELTSLTFVKYAENVIYPNE